MKLAIVTDKLARGDGQGRVNLEIAKHALASGHQVVAIASQVDPELLSAGAEWWPVRTFIDRPNLLKVVSFARRANALLSRSRGSIDVVLGNGYSLTCPHQVNSAHFVHGAWIKSSAHIAHNTAGPYAWYQWLYSKCNSSWEKKSFAASNIVVAVSEKIRDELVGIGVSAEKIRVIYNGVDLEEFRPGQEDRAALGLPAAKPLALFAGDIRTKRKNLDTTLRAVAMIPNLHLAVAGSVERSPFPAMAHDLGLDQRVKFLGFRRDMGKLMRAADLFIFPSRYEAGTLVLLEALATGLPVVTARTTGGCEVMDAQAGRIIEDPDNAADLALAIRTIVDDESARSAASKAARAIAEQYSWSRMAQTYLELFEEVARSRSKSLVSNKLSL